MQRKNLIYLSILIGVSALWTQLFYLRLALNVFQGNELVVGICMFQWLLGISAGAAWADKIKLPRLSILFLIIGLLMILEGLVLLSFQNLIGVSPFALSQFGIILLVSFVTFFPVCFLFGCTYTILSRKLETTDKQGAISIYRAEAIGSILAGLFFALLVTLPGDSTLYFLPAVAAFIICSRFIIDKHGNKFRFGFVLIILCVLIILNPFKRLELHNYPGMKLLTVFDTPFKRCTITEYDTQVSLHSFGRVLLSSVPTSSVEETMIMPLLINKKIENILYLGLPLADLVEISELIADSIDIVYHDEDVIRKSKDTGLRIPINIIVSDERAYLRENRKKYDLIQLLAREPSTNIENRFFTREFFRLVKGHLTTHGLFFFSLVGAENRFNRDQGALYKSIHKALQEEFSYVKVIWGAPTHFVASAHEIHTDRNYLSDNFDLLPKKPTFFNQSILIDKTSDFRQTSFQNFLESLPDTPENTDLHPSSYPYALRIWFSKGSSDFSITNDVKVKSVLIINLFCLMIITWLFSSKNNSLLPVKRITLIYLIATGVLDILVFTKRIPFYFFMSAFSFLFYLFIFVPNLSGYRFPRKRLNWFLIIIAFFTGFISMGLQIVIIGMFQILVGNIYWMITVLFALFMAGLSLGSFLLENNKRSDRFFLYNISYIVIAMVMLIVFIILGHGVASTRILEASALFAIFLDGFFAGVCYGITQRIRGRIFPQSSPGILYMADSVGAGLSAISTAVLLLPIFGAVTTVTGLLTISIVGVVVPIILSIKK